MAPTTFDLRAPVGERYSRWLTEGYPELGWSGDPGLRLVFAKLEQRWEVWSHEPRRNDPDRHVMIAKGPPGGELNDEAVHLLIRRLVERDTHRAGNSALEQFERAMAANERRDREHTRQAADSTADALGKFYYEAARAVGEPLKFHW